MKWYMKKWIELYWLNLTLTNCMLLINASILHLITQHTMGQCVYMIVSSSLLMSYRFPWFSILMSKEPTSWLLAYRKHVEWGFLCTTDMSEKSLFIGQCLITRTHILNISLLSSSSFSVSQLSSGSTSLFCLHPSGFSQCLLWFMQVKILIHDFIKIIIEEYLQLWAL